MVINLLRKKLASLTPLSAADYPKEESREKHQLAPAARAADADTAAGGAAAADARAVDAAGR